MGQDAEKIELGNVALVTPHNDVLSETRHWNFDVVDNQVVVCKGNHHRSEGCQHEVLTPHEILSLLTKYRAQLLENLSS